MMQLKNALQVALKGNSEVIVTRKFNAPPALVFRAMTEPDLITRWMLGPPGWSMPVCEVDLRVGGRYRYGWQNDETGAEFGFVGETLEIDAPNRIVQTQRGDGDDSMGEAVIALELVARGDYTQMNMVMDFGSVSVRDQALATGMTDGMGISYDLLDAVLASQVSV